jgi:hypothetical protein
MLVKMTFIALSSVPGSSNDVYPTGRVPGNLSAVREGVSVSFMERSVAFDLVTVLLSDGRGIYLRDVRIDREKLLTTGDLIFYSGDSAPDGTPLAYFPEGAWMGYLVGEMEEAEEA